MKLQAVAGQRTRLSTVYSFACSSLFSLLLSYRPSRPPLSFRDLHKPLEISTSTGSYLHVRKQEHVVFAFIDPVTAGLGKRAENNNLHVSTSYSATNSSLCRGLFLLTSRVQLLALRSIQHADLKQPARLVLSSFFTKPCGL